MKTTAAAIALVNPDHIFIRSSVSASRVAGPV
jgi:hypothetical protein